VSIQNPITFVVAIPANRRGLLQNNLLASPCFRGPHAHQIIIQEDYSSASKAYNDAINRSQNDLIVFLHSDIILPELWVSDLQRALDYLDADDPQWGVIGCYGETLHDNGRGYIYSSGLGIMGKPFERPERIQTLDEIVLVLRKSSGLRFDETLPYFHMYGTDICMTAEEAGRKNYAISAFCIHNTQPGLILADDFYECYWHIRRKWKNRLPIRTTCVRVTRYNYGMYRRRMGEMYVRYIHRKEFGGSRVADVPRLLHEVDELLKQKSAPSSNSSIALRETTV
jgi:hypothetical protein